MFKSRRSQSGLVSPLEPPPASTAAGNYPTFAGQSSSPQPPNQGFQGGQFAAQGQGQGQGQGGNRRSSVSGGGDFGQLVPGAGGAYPDQRYPAQSTQSQQYRNDQWLANQFNGLPPQAQSRDQYTQSSAPVSDEEKKARRRSMPLTNIPQSQSQSQFLAPPNGRPSSANQIDRLSQVGLPFSIG